MAGGIGGSSVGIMVDQCRAVMHVKCTSEEVKLLKSIKNTCEMPMEQYDKMKAIHERLFRG